jgi:hypothetical protein
VAKKNAVTTGMIWVTALILGEGTSSSSHQLCEYQHTGESQSHFGVIELVLTLWIPEASGGLPGVYGYTLGIAVIEYIDSWYLGN